MDRKSAKWEAARGTGADLRDGVEGDVGPAAARLEPALQCATDGSLYAEDEVIVESAADFHRYLVETSVVLGDVEDPAKLRGLEGNLASMTSTLVRVASELERNKSRLMEKYYQDPNPIDETSPNTEHPLVPLKDHHLQDDANGALSELDVRDAMWGDEGHGDDGYCALCRRCQMRKRLERRRVTKKERAMEDDEEERTHVPVAAQEDERSIDELLLFIGEDTGGTPGASRSTSKSHKQKRKQKVLSPPSTATARSSPPLAFPAGPKLHQPQSRARADSASHDREQLADGDEGDCGSVSTSTVSRDDHSDGQSVGTKARTEGRERHDTVLFSKESLPVDHEFLNLENDSQSEPEFTKEEQEALDREVEEFRLRLEAARVSPLAGEAK